MDEHTKNQEPMYVMATCDQCDCERKLVKREAKDDDELALMNKERYFIFVCDECGYETKVQDHRKPRRRAILQISTGLLVELLSGLKEGFSGHYRVIGNALPKDAKALGTISIEAHTVGIVIESDTFKEVSPGEELPVLDDPILETIRTEP